MIREKNIQHVDNFILCDLVNNLAQTNSGSFYVKNWCETHDEKLLSSLVFVLHVAFSRSRYSFSLFVPSPD